MFDTSDPVTVDVVQSPSLSISKSASPTSVTAAGQNVAYTFSVTNSGDVTLTGVGVTDVPVSPAGSVTAACVVLTSPAGTCSGPTTTLAPGQTAVFTGNYTVTQADINHGSIKDTAVAAGTSPSSTPVTATSSQVTVSVTQSPSLSIAKSANPTTVTGSGQSVTYTFSVTNTGNLTLTSVGVTDVPTAPAGGVTATCQVLAGPAGTCSGTTTTLLPGQTALFTGLYSLTQADVNHGSVVDHATTQGTTPSGGTVNATSNAVTVTVTQSPSLSIAKSANPTTVTAAGQSIAYTFTVVNTGNLTLTSVGVTDVPTAPAGGVTATCKSLSDPSGPCSGTTTTLLPGQNAQFTGSYTVTQADVNHGSVVDHATTQGTTPSSGTVNATSNAVTVTVTQSPSLSIAKSANPTTVTAAGQSIAYTFTVVNTGNLTLTSVGVTDVPTAPAGGVTATCQEPQRPDRPMLGGDHHLAAGPERHLQGYLHGDPGRRQPRLGRRPCHGAGDHPVERHGQRHLKYGHGGRDPVARPFPNQGGQPDHADAGGRDDHLHVRRHQYGQRQPHGRRRDGQRPASGRARSPPARPARACRTHRVRAQGRPRPWLPARRPSSPPATS